MGWFKKKDDVVDLGERYRRQQERIAQESAKPVEEAQEAAPTFFQGLVNAAQKQNEEQAQVKEQDDEVMDLGDSIEKRRQKLTKRMMEVTSRLEELSNQIYHLTQRIELVERKMNINPSG